MSCTILFIFIKMRSFRFNL